METLAGGQLSQKYLERPILNRHVSSWLARLHGHHDAKRHPEQQPLLADGLPSPDIEAQEVPAQPTRPFSVYARNLYQGVRQSLKQVVIAVLITLVTALAVFSHRASTASPLCTSAACVHAASGVLHSLSPNYTHIDPCEQFDKFACQGFEERHDLRPDQGDMFRGTLMAEEAEITLRHILEAGSAEAADKANFLKLKSDYVACVDEKTIQSYGLKPLKAITDQIKWAYSTAADSGTSKEMTDVFIYMTKLGLDPLVALFVGADDKEPDTQIVFLSPGSLGLPSKEYYENNQTVALYQSMVATVLNHFYETSGNSTYFTTSSETHSRLHFADSEDPVPRGRQVTAAGLAKGIVKFEIDLAAATPSEEDLEDITKAYNKVNVTDLALPFLSVEEVVRQLGPKDYLAKSVIVASPSYMQELSKIMTATPLEVVQGFFTWKAIQAYSSRIEDPALEPLTRFYNELQGKEPDAKVDRWRRCVRAADADLGWILSKFFVDKAFSPESKQFGDQIVSDIKESFIGFLNKASWMSSDNRDRAITKVHAIDQKIGYPTSNPDILDPEALHEYYKDVTIKNSTFFENALQVSQFETRLRWAKLGKPTRHDEWGMTVPTVNAYYNPAGNEIVFPAGIMQSPVFYDPSVPQYLSYGAFGAVAGHELSHAFDNTGSQYDETGKFVDWWSNETRSAFEKKTSCFVHQYEKYSVTGPNGQVHVNGRLTLGENVADAGGIHAAYKAWKKRDAESPGKLLPGLEHFTKDQMFFVNYANWWCGKSTQETAVRRIYTDPHAPKFARILGTMANSADFRNAFNCPTKEPTCDLW